LGQSQEVLDPLGNVPCGHVHETDVMLENASPSELMRYNESRQELENFTQQYIQNNQISATNQSRTISYTIPVVFHVIHNGGPENISDAQVLDALDILNRDYQMLNADTSVVVTPFKNLVADIEIEFKLANIDPSGECTNGITRTVSSVTSDANASGYDRIQAVVNEHGVWPGDEYLNIYVAAQIGGAAGYTYKPSNWGGTGTTMNNGIHILSNYVGSIGTGSTSLSRALTHEVGHWLNLDHLWGGSNNPGQASNCGIDDAVADTPSTLGWTSCNLQGTTCDNNLDNVQNYMEYSYCSRMFTVGQKARMHAALNSTVGGRNNIWSAANLVATGVNNPDQFCKANFQTSTNEVCAGTAVSFQDLSFDAPTSWNWSFPGATPATSTDQNPVVVYDTPGTYQVSLTASDGAVTDTETKSAYITVLPKVTNLPFLESFVSNTIPSEFWVRNNIGGTAQWQRTTSAGYTDNSSAMLFNYAQPDGSVDEFISQSFDLSNVDPNVGVTMTFRYAYRKRSAADYEVLRVYFSSDCGENWSQRKILFGSQLGTDISTTAWTPQGQNDWETVHLTNITSQFWTENFRVKFTFESGGGNNIFIDDINLYDGSPSNDILTINEESIIENFVIYPNPSAGVVNVNFTTPEATQASIAVVDILGKVITQTDVNTTIGQNNITLADKLAAGTYMVRVSLADGSQQTKKLIVK
ncbi:M43 family zinc metalloprotease, partial [Lishizhenia sp.]|uniref:zinc-dependent metalloprotease n=1 Tax=Lishizhenia sp. TaxID=2497594 RepID=UPI00299F19B7